MLSDHLIELPDTGEKVRFLGVNFFRYRNFYRCLDAEGLADEIEVRPLILPSDRAEVCTRLRSLDEADKGDVDLLMRMTFSGLIAGVRHSDEWMQVQNLLWAAAAEILEARRVEHVNDLIRAGAMH